MGDIVDINKNKDNFKHCSYADFYGEIGVSLLDRSLCIYPLNNSEFVVGSELDSIILSREKLAEFIHIAKALIDSEDRFLIEEELIGRNYED